MSDTPELLSDDDDDDDSDDPGYNMQDEIDDRMP